MTPSTDSQDDMSRARLIYLGNELPNSDLSGLFRLLQKHSKDRSHPILARFLDEATVALRDEIRELPADDRTQFPTFETILSWAESPGLGASGAIDGVLLCVFQIATYIGYFESNRDPASLKFDLSEQSLSGLGIGLLATSAISLASSLADLPKTGSEVVRLAFRLGMLVADVSQNLEARDPTDSSSNSDSWAYVVHSVTEDAVQKELDEIHAREHTPETNQIFISAPARTSVTVSGPPSRLKALFRTSGFFRDSKSIPLPVFGGLCHAKHIYNQQHIAKVVATKSLPNLTTLRTRVPVFSTSTGVCFETDTAEDLFKQIIHEILTQQIRWEEVVKGIVEHARRSVAAECQILTLRTSLSVSDLAAAFGDGLPDVATVTEDITRWLSSDVDSTSSRGTMQSKIAIVGMSCRLPSGATSTEKFWELLENGLDVHRRIPADRFDVTSHWDPEGKRVNTSHTQYGCFIDEPGLFDAPFFHMSPTEAAQTDPMQRLSLVTAYEALEKAGYVANRTAATNLHRIGTWYGQASDDYREVNTAQNISTYFIPGGCRAFGPGRINYFFKFSGPSFNCDTACSSSLATIQAACSALWSGEVDTVVAGGMNVLTNSDAFAGLSHGHFLTKTPNACKTWDSEADGYCRADAVVSIVMKRLEDAIADNDNISGVILSAATNHSANAVSITHPHAGHQADLTRLVLGRAGVDPLDVSFVEMHGTGTQAGDIEEIQSVANVFAPAARRRSTKQPLHIGAVKSNVGHSEAAAGVTALLKVLLMLKNEAIPPHVGIKNSINPAFPEDLGERGVRIPFERQPWKQTPEKKRIAVVNNFSAAGGNTSLLVEEAPMRPELEHDPRATWPIAVSAKSKVSLRGNLERLMSYLEDHPETSLASLSYSTTARHYQHNHRIAVASSSVANLQKQLAAAHDTLDTHRPIPTTGPPPIAFVFTGQGASHQSMDLDLFSESPMFRSQILNLNSIATSQGFPSFIPALDGSHEKDFRHAPVITQLALVCSEIALVRYWGSLGVRPSVVVGHSLGEYAAMHIAGVLTASDVVHLVGTRARLLEQRCQVGSHKMVAIRASVEEIAALLGENFNEVEIACINGPGETVVSGSNEAIEKSLGLLQQAGRCVVLDVAFAFHSAQTEPILDDFETAAQGVLYNAPHLPYVSPLLGKVVFDDQSINAKYVRRATREPVNFLAALAKAQKVSVIDDTTAWVEIGPHPVCLGFVKSSHGSSAHLAVPSMKRTETNWATLATSLAALHCAGLAIDWNEYHRPFERAVHLLDLPTYAWNDKNYWLQYNGDWALTKGNNFYDAEKGVGTMTSSIPAAVSSFSTSTVHKIIEQSCEGSSGHVVMESDLMRADLHASANGHSMNGCGVVTSSIHADIAYTLGQYLHDQLVGKSNNGLAMNIAKLEVTKGLVVKNNTTIPQLIQVLATTTDLSAADLEWSNVSSEDFTLQPFATARIIYEDASKWLSDWMPLTHLIHSRIADLDRMAIAGTANRFSRNMAYTLFAQNLVDYAAVYRGMRAVVVSEFEAYADITLSESGHGNFTVPPYFIDSVAHLAGFVMNCSDASDVKSTFCVTPGWESMRFAKPLVAGESYRSYVKMIPLVDTPTTYLGDVYIMHADGAIIGVVGGIQFRRYPRVLLGRFFSPPDSKEAKDMAAQSGSGAARCSKISIAPRASAAETPAPATAAASTTAAIVPAPAPVTVVKTEPTEPKAPDSNVPRPGPNPTVLAESSTAIKALSLIARETGLGVSDLSDDAGFADIGVDSLMSLVIAEKFRTELGVVVGGSLFLEYPTIGDMRGWLEEYYS